MVNWSSIGNSLGWKVPVRYIVRRRSLNGKMWGFAVIRWFEYPRDEGRERNEKILQGSVDTDSADKSPIRCRVLFTIEKGLLRCTLACFGREEAQPLVLSLLHPVFPPYPYPFSSSRSSSPRNEDPRPGASWAWEAQTLSTTIVYDGGGGGGRCAPRYSLFVYGNGASASPPISDNLYSRSGITDVEQKRREEIREKEISLPFNFSSLFPSRVSSHFSTWDYNFCTIYTKRGGERAAVVELYCGSSHSTGVRESRCFFYFVLFSFLFLPWK